MTMDPIVNRQLNSFNSHRDVRNCKGASFGHCILVIHVTGPKNKIFFKKGH